VTGNHWPRSSLASIVTKKHGHQFSYDHVSKVLPAQVQATPLVASGALTVPVAAVYPIDKIKEPLEHIDKGGENQAYPYLEHEERIFEPRCQYVIGRSA
jgi:hypothetical protein